MSINWSSFPANTFAGRALRFSLRLIPKGQVVRVRSGLNRGMFWIVGAGTHGCWLGTYETEKQNALARFVKPGMKVLDIGANAGFYTLAFSRLVGDAGHVWALEPFAQNVAHLLTHIRQNRLRNVSVVQVAVGRRSSISGFQIAGNGFMGQLHDGSPYQVPVTSLDEFIEAGVLPIPDLIKIDIEGAESRLLEGAKAMLAKRQTTLFIALHGEEQKQRCRDLLVTTGYDLYSLYGRARLMQQAEFPRD